MQWPPGQGQYQAGVPSQYGAPRGHGQGADLGHVQGMGSGHVQGTSSGPHLPPAQYGAASLEVSVLFVVLL